MRIILFFGVWSPDRLGHFIYNRSGHTCYYDSQLKELRCPFPYHFADGLFPPPFVNEREDLTALTHIHGWTVLAMWDRSGDKRPASNAAFLMPGTHDEATMWQEAIANYPQIVARLKAAPK